MADGSAPLRLSEEAREDVELLLERKYNTLMESIGLAEQQYREMEKRVRLHEKRLYSVEKRGAETAEIIHRMCENLSEKGRALREMSAMLLEHATMIRGMNDTILDLKTFMDREMNDRFLELKAIMYARVGTTIMRAVANIKEEIKAEVIKHMEMKLQNTDVVVVPVEDLTTKIVEEMMAKLMVEGRK